MPSTANIATIIIKSFIYNEFKLNNNIYSLNRTIIIYRLFDITRPAAFVYTKQINKTGYFRLIKTLPGLSLFCWHLKK